MKDTIETIMSQAQVFASAWALVGGRFDSGDGMELAEQEKQDLRTAIEQALTAKPNINCKSEQKRLATMWGYVKADDASKPVEVEPIGYIHPGAFKRLMAGEPAACRKKTYGEPNEIPIYTAPPAHQWTARELELIDGMIEAQLQHAERCAQIASPRIADKMKGWDMERVALLRKMSEAAPPARVRKYCI